MNIQQALNIFDLSGELTEQDIKKTYKQAALKFHPDRNPVGAEMMKAVNAAFDFLMQNIDRINDSQSSDDSARYNFGEELENVLSTLQGMAGVIFEVAGNWIWISGGTKAHKDAIKALGCKWASKKDVVLSSRRIQSQPEPQGAQYRRNPRNVRHDRPAERDRI